MFKINAVGWTALSVLLCIAAVIQIANTLLLVPVIWLPELVVTRLLVALMLLLFGIRYLVRAKKAFSGESGVAIQMTNGNLDEIIDIMARAKSIRSFQKLDDGEAITKALTEHVIKNLKSKNKGEEDAQRPPT